MTAPEERPGQENGVEWVGGRARLDGPVHLAAYDPAWPERFEREAGRIRAALGDHIVRLEHVGSTSVAGLAAKPVIDVVLTVADARDEASYVPRLESAGYHLRVREPRWYEHRCFKPADESVNLHVFSDRCEEAGRMLAFRDQLRRNANDRELYERTKRMLAAKRWSYLQEYADAKAGFVAEILTRCRAQLPLGVETRVSATPTGASSPAPCRP
jgi:GrpB-like predicted nucleotidyltransferase (UPF0157 family)